MSEFFFLFLRKKKKNAYSMDRQLTLHWRLNQSRGYLLNCFISHMKAFNCTFSMVWITLLKIDCKKFILYQTYPWHENRFGAYLLLNFSMFLFIQGRKHHSNSLVQAKYYIECLNNSHHNFLSMDGSFSEKLTCT